MIDPIGPSIAFKEAKIGAMICVPTLKRGTPEEIELLNFGTSLTHLLEAIGRL